MFNRERIKTLEAEVEKLRSEVDELKSRSRFRYIERDDGNYLFGVYKDGITSEETHQDYQYSDTRHTIDNQYLIEKIYEYLEIEIEVLPQKSRAIRIKPKGDEDGS